MLELNLEKSTETLFLCLEKAGMREAPEMDVLYCLDVSGSYEDEHAYVNGQPGLTTRLLGRLIPFSLAFDPDKKIELFTFSDGPRSVENNGTVTADNYRDFIKNKVIGKAKGWCGGTDYSYVIAEALQFSGWMGERKKGFMSSIFGKPKVTKPKKTLVIINTDGENMDKADTTEVLRQSEARGDLVYFLFVAVANGRAKFPYLNSLGDRFKNTGLVTIPNLSEWVLKSDEEINQEIISDELIEWLNK